MGFYFAFNSPTHTSGPDFLSSLGWGLLVVSMTNVMVVLSEWCGQPVFSCCTFLALFIFT